MPKNRGSKGNKNVPGTFQRRLGSPKREPKALVNNFRNESDGNVRVFKTRHNDSGLEELLPITGRSAMQETSDTKILCMPRMNDEFEYQNFDVPTLDRPLINKACGYAPESHDFGQVIRASFNSNDTPKQRGSSEIRNPLDPAFANEVYQRLLLEQYGFNPHIGKNVKQVFNMENVNARVNTSSQVNHEVNAISTETTWHCVNNIEDMEKFFEIDTFNEHLRRGDAPLMNARVPASPFLTASYIPTQDIVSPQNTFSVDVHISEKPRVKVIAEKYNRFKKNNIEVRRLEEKIVCVEYDVFESELDQKPQEIMRAYFSIRNTSDKCEQQKTPLDVIPSGVKNKLNITENDVKDMNTKEIEVLDSHIPENRCYIEDLKKVMKKRREIRDKKNRTSLDLMSLYEMAKRDSPSLDHDHSNTNLLSKAELDEIHELILKECLSNARGINRKIVKPQPSSEIRKLSESILFVGSTQ